MRKLPLHTKIMIAILLGFIFALLSTRIEGGKAFVQDFIAPFGVIFINLLKLIAIPLIFVAVIKGISDLKDTRALSKIGLKTLVIFLISAIVAVLIGVGGANLLKPGNNISDDTKEKITAVYEASVTEKTEALEENKKRPPLQLLVDLVPGNLFQSLSGNQNMLQVIFFSFFFGIGLVYARENEYVRAVRNFFNGIYDIIIKLIDFIMKMAPLGVFALMCSVLAESLTVNVLATLALYTLCIVLCLLSVMLLYVLILWRARRKNPFVFLRDISATMLMGFSTSSSAATLPVTMNDAKEKLKISDQVASFVLPIGANINKVGTTQFQAIAAIFIAQVFGVELSFATQMGIVITATVAAIASAAVPGSGIIMLATVLTQAQIPLAGIALVLVLDRPLDMLRTIINVAGDQFTALLIDKK